MCKFFFLKKQVPYLFSIGSLFFTTLLIAQKKDTISASTSYFQSITSEIKQDRLKWWQDARFGMFIHWGVFAVPAGVWKGVQVHGRAGIPDYAEWLMYNKQIPCAEYQTLAKQFTASKFDPAAWVKLAKDAGMKYIVITAKHHDGFALFKTKASPFNIVDASPYGKDAIKALSDECKRQGMKLGFYYSQAQDWNNGGSVGLAGMGDKAPPAWDSSQKQNMDTYVNQVAIPQITELLTNYGDDIPAIIWWDTPRGMTKVLAQKIDKVVHQLKPNIIMNNRMGGGVQGDSKTPEQYIPALGYPGQNWESCMTTNNSWGYQTWDNQWKSSAVLLRNLSDIVSKGGNYLLNVGPDKEGVIPKTSAKILKEVGNWLKVNGEAVYQTKASPFVYLPWGRCTQKDDKLYLHIHHWPADGSLKIPIISPIEKAYLLADKNTNVKYKQQKLFTMLTLPKHCPDTTITVIVLKIKGAIKSSIENPIPSMGKTATASSTESDKFKADYAFDSSSRTSWKAAKDQKTGWLMINLEKPTSIGSIAISEVVGHTEENTKHFKLEYKKGNDWVTITEGKKIGEVFQTSFKPITTQFVRLNILEAETEPQIRDMQLFFDK